MEYLTRNLRYFLAIAEQGSLRKAAASLRVSPPTLSIAMKQLEVELGSKLFQPDAEDARSLMLTSFGERFAQGLIQESRQLEQLAKRAQAGEAELPIRFGVVSHWALRHVIPSLPVLEQKFGKLQAQFGYSAKILDEIRAGALDFGIITWGHRKPRWHNQVMIGVDPEAIVGLKSKYGQVLAKATSLDDLRRERWIWHRMPQKGVEDYLKRGESGFVVDHYELLKKLLFAGQGIASVQLESFSTEEKKKLAVSRIKVRPHGDGIGLILVYNDGLSEHCRELMTHLEKMLKRALK